MGWLTIYCIFFIDIIYLSGGGHPYEGTIHLKHNNAWGSVCDDFFEVNDAIVVCRMLGYHTL
jgi:deleted-in-malignant-brain-tumors protein 1